MKILTTRFGAVEIEPNDIIHFPAGMLGLDGCEDWVLLADAQNEILGWLQSTTRADVALAVVSPRRFVRDYQLRVARGDLGALAGGRPEELYILVIVSKQERSLTLNLKAPLVISLHHRMGRQVINNADQPLQFEVSCALPARKSVA